MRSSENVIPTENDPVPAYAARVYPEHALSRSGSFLVARPPGMKPSKTLFFSVFICLFSPLLFGFSLAFTSPAQETMLGHMQNITGGEQRAPPEDLIVFDNAGQASAFASIINIGCMIGSFVGAGLSDKYGRRVALAISAVPLFMTWPLVGLLSNWLALTLLRLVMGIGVGIGSAVAPCYIGEVATLELRGALGAMNQLSITLGIFFANLMGTFLFVAGDGDKFCQWRYLAYFCGALGVCVLSTMFIPESPRFYAKQGDLANTRRSLMKLRKVTENFDEELMEIVNQTPALRRAMSIRGTELGQSSQGLVAAVARAAEPTQQTQSGNAQLGSDELEEEQQAASICATRYRKSFIVGIGLLIFQQMSGCNAIIFYVSSICTEAGIPNANLAGTMAMAAQAVFTLAACVLMEKFNRRTFLFFSMSVCAASNFAIAWYFYAQSQDQNPPAMFALSAIGLFIVGFSFGLGPIPWLMLAELFTTEVRGVASSIAIATNWGCSFLVTLGFSTMLDVLGHAGTFFMFGAVVSFGLLFVACIVPETRGKNIDEVLAALNGKPAPPTALEASARDVLLNQSSLRSAEVNPVATHA